MILSMVITFKVQNTYLKIVIINDFFKEQNLFYIYLVFNRQQPCYRDYITMPRLQLAY